MQFLRFCSSFYPIKCSLTPPMVCPVYGAPAPSPVSWRQQADSVSAPTCTRFAVWGKGHRATPSNTPFSLFACKNVLSSLTLILLAGFRSTGPLGVEWVSKAPSLNSVSLPGLKGLVRAEKKKKNPAELTCGMNRW